MKIELFWRLVKIKPPEKEVTQGAGGLSLIKGIKAHQWCFPTVHNISSKSGASSSS